VHPETVSRPIPVPTALTAGFWQAASRHQLAIQRCATCGWRFHPPVPICTHCHGEELRYEKVSGHGTVYSCTLVTADLDPRFEAAVPLLVAAIELDEQDGLVVVANIVNAAPPSVRIGDRCDVVFETLPGGLVLPQFRLSGRSDA
jgi:uncharacterized protein